MIQFSTKRMLTAVSLFAVACTLITVTKGIQSELVSWLVTGGIGAAFGASIGTLTGHARFWALVGAIGLPVGLVSAFWIAIHFHWIGID